jgi:hypothetical protein
LMRLHRHLRSLADGASPWTGLAVNDEQSTRKGYDRPLTSRQSIASTRSRSSRAVVSEATST